jgi:D-sedoheptulose 7-phosphate isomerase
VNDRIAAQLTTSAQAIAALPTADVAEIARRLDVAQREGRLIAICGNGGSAATAQHMAADLNKNTGRRFRCVCLSDNVAQLTAVANDRDYDLTFADPMWALLGPNDVLVIISASGASPNIVTAAQAARRATVQVLGLLGMGGGAARRSCDAAVVVDSDDYGAIEDAHLAIVHALVVALRGEA